MSAGVEERVRAIAERLRAETERVERGEATPDELRTLFFGRKAGLLSAALKDLGNLPAGERALAGKLLNQAKTEVESEIERLCQTAPRPGSAPEQRPRPAARTRISAQDKRQPAPDLTLPGRLPPRGTPHPLSLVRDELERIFLEMGYALAEGPEIDDDFHCFEGLNVPRDHPARDMQDSLYVGSEWLLRPHTSNVQIHTMERQPPPIKVVSIGRCYRRDTADATHSPMFHQIEGLLVDEGITMAHLKGTLAHLSRRLFGATEVRLRPSYFPFTEPSAELDISCFACARRGCALCKGSGFIELGGCGMVDPGVFAAVGIDPERFSGFAFGFGIERAAMLKHGIDDIRLFFENDLRFLAQFPARA